MNVNENCSDDLAGQKHEKYLGQISRAFNPFNGDRENALGRYTNMGYNHADAQKTAADYLGADLVSTKPVNVYSAPNGTLVNAYGAGREIGTIYSWVEVPKGVIWWHLENGTFVKHETGAFDKSRIESSLEIKRLKEKRELEEMIDKKSFFNTKVKPNVEGLFDGIFGTIEKIIVGVIVAVIIATVFKLS